MEHEKDFIVLRTDFRSLEDVLNSVFEEYPLYSIFQILSENNHNGSLAVVILEKMEI